MSILDDTVSIPRRIMTLFFMIDASGTMEGSKIGALNDAVVNVIPILEEISANNPDAEIKVAALVFSTSYRWLYDEPKLANEFVWQDVKANGLTSFGAACEELDNKMSLSNGFMQSNSGSYAPVIILLSDGAPTDNWKSGLEKLKANIWFKSAIKVAIAIGDDADKNVLAEFTGTSSAVVTVRTIEALKAIVRMVAVTSSKIGSQSCATGGATKQDQVNSDLQYNVNKIEGAEVAAKVDGGSCTDDWD